MLRKLIMHLDVGNQRLEELELGTCALYRVVGPGQVVEVVDQIGDLGTSIERLEHVAADEIVQIVDRLHRHGLVEELHGLLGFDAEVPSEVSAVLGKGIVQAGSGIPKPSLQDGELGAELGELFGDGQVGIGDHKESLGLADISCPEYLGQCDGRSEVGVREHTEDDRELPVVSKSDRP